MIGDRSASCRRHNIHMSPCAITATADKRNLSAKTAPGIFFKSDWRIHDTGFNANNSVSPIGRRSSQTNVSIRNCLSQMCHNGRESKTRFYFPDRNDRVSQIAADAGDKCSIYLQRDADRSPIVSQTDHRPLRSYGNQAKISLI